MKKSFVVGLLVILGFLFSLFAYCEADELIYGCYAKKSGALRIVNNLSLCKTKTENPISWPKNWGSCTCDPPTNGLVAYYPFDGSAMDASGNGHHGQVVGATLTSDRDDNANRAYHFNGIDNYISVSPGDVFASNQFTICAMVYIEEQVTSNCCPRIVHRMAWDSTAGTGYDVHYQKYGSNYNGFLSFNIFDSSHQEFNVVSPQALEYGRWNQIAVTYDGNTIKFYFNGRLNQTKSVSSPIMHTPNASFLIGSDGGEGSFKGKIDELYFYNRALTDKEILQFMRY